MDLIEQQAVEIHLSSSPHHTQLVVIFQTWVSGRLNTGPHTYRATTFPTNPHATPSPTPFSEQLQSGGYLQCPPTLNGWVCSSTIEMASRCPLLAELAEDDLSCLLGMDCLCLFPFDPWLSHLHGHEGLAALESMLLADITAHESAHLDVLVLKVKWCEFLSSLEGLSVLWWW